MSIKSDKWIRRMAAEHQMIEPFEPGQVREVNGVRIVSFGTSSYGPNSTLNVVAAVGALGTASGAALTIAVRDELAVTGTFALAGNRITGPALIEEHASTTVLMPGDACEVDAYGNLVIAVGKAR